MKWTCWGLVGWLVLGGVGCSGGEQSDAGAGAQGNSGGSESSGGSSSGSGGETASGGATSGGASGGGTDPGGGSAGTSSGGSGAGSGGTSSGGGTSAGGTSGGSSGGTASGARALGTVQILYRIAQPSSHVSINFRPVDPAADTFREDNGLSCTVTESGGCRLSACPEYPDGVEPPDGPRLSAGNVTVTAGSVDGVASDFSSVSTPGGSSLTGYQDMEEGTLGGGEPLSIVASGGDISAFSGDVDLPLVGYLTSHAAGGTAREEVSVPVPRTEDLVLSWDTRMTAQTVDVVTGAASSFPGESRTLTCRFDASAGSGTVPVELLSELEAGTDLYLFSSNRTELVVPEGTLALLAAFQMWTEARAGVPLLLLE